MFEFIIGSLVGIYLAQNCVLPNLQNTVSNWIVSRNSPVTITPDEETPKKAEVFTGKMPKDIEMTRIETEKRETEKSKNINNSI